MYGKEYLEYIEEQKERQERIDEAVKVFANVLVQEKAELSDVAEQIKNILEASKVIINWTVFSVQAEDYRLCIISQLERNARHG